MLTAVNSAETVIVATVVIVSTVAGGLIVFTLADVEVVVGPVVVAGVAMIVTTAVGVSAATVVKFVVVEVNVGTIVIDSLDFVGEITEKNSEVLSVSATFIVFSDVESVVVSTIVVGNVVILLVVLSGVFDDDKNDVRDGNVGASDVVIVEGIAIAVVIVVSVVIVVAAGCDGVAEIP